MKGVRIRLVEVERRERPYRLRMPFKFGVTVATHGRQAILRARISLDGREAVGYAAEALGAKWFDKNLALSDSDNHHQLRKALELASDTYLAAPAATPFDHFAASYQAHVDACEALGLNPLIASYGQSLVDRAMFDALCRARGISFYEAMRSNLAGLRPSRIAPEMNGVDFDRLFAETKPAIRIDVRHTVGLLDPITEADLEPEMRVDDGLPETLQDVIDTYGNRYFKLKLGGDDAADLDRIGRIASVLDRADRPYFVTLDGNEQYPDSDSIARFFRKISEVPSLARLASSILYVEQPIHRKEALARPITELATLVPVIIDESDGTLSAFALARALGYSGVSSKACKGIYKSIINYARCEVWNEHNEGRYFMSAEDLTCEPGIAIQQDLALVNLLGLTHVERNAHHFIDGFGCRSEAEASAFLVQHPDLYHSQHGRVRLRLIDGSFEIGSLDQVGFGTPVDPDFAAAELMPISSWPTPEKQNDRRV